MNMKIFEEDSDDSYDEQENCIESPNKIRRVARKT